MKAEPRQAKWNELKRRRWQTVKRKLRHRLLGVDGPPWKDWNEDTTQHQEVLRLRAASYHVERLFSDPPKPAPRLNPDYVLSPNGNYAYVNSLLPAGLHLNLFGEPEGIVVWDAEVILPALVDMNIKGRDGSRFSTVTSERHRAAWGSVWMSLTPAEMMSQRSGIQMAEGKVLIGGLGLGWFLRKVCEKESVKEVIVVDRSEELLSWYGHYLCGRFPKVTEVICDDVYNHIGRHGDCQYLLDIWPTYAGARHDSRLIAARKEVGDRLWAWGVD